MTDSLGAHVAGAPLGKAAHPEDSPTKEYAEAQMTGHLDQLCCPHCHSEPHQGECDAQEG